ncbi:MAG: methionyl-tRNA formyltransferase, partial [Anaerovoracaceae bacterium]
GHQVVFAVSQPDAKRDRGKKLKPTPVKELAENYGIEVLQPASIKNNTEEGKEFINKVIFAEADIIVVIAYGKILPKEIIESAKLATINAHASLLPKYRGAAPIHKAVWEGEKETGVTIMHIAEGLDSGDVIISESVSIEEKTAEELHAELAGLSAALLVKAIKLIEEGKAARTPQNHQLATYAPLIKKEDAKINFNNSAIEISNHIRAMDSWPGAYTIFRGEKVKIFSPKILETSGNSLREYLQNELENTDIAGRIIMLADDGLVVGTGQGLVKIKEIQLPGKRRMLVKEFLKGNSIEILEQLG